MNVIWKSLPLTFLTLGWVLPEANWEPSVSTWIQPRSICCHLHGEEGHEHECWPSPGCDGWGHIASKLKQKLNSEEKMSILSGYLEKAMAPHSSTLAWKIPWVEESGRLGPWGLEESDTTERLHFHFSLSCIGEGNGNPLQCSCLENPRDGGAWWASVYGVAQSRTQLKWLSGYMVIDYLDDLFRKIHIQFSCLFFCWVFCLCLFLISLRNFF